MSRAPLNYIAAIEYLQRGWSVIPVRTDQWNPEEPEEADKSPYINWREFAKRLPTIEEVQSWYKRWPNAGVGIVTGGVSKLVVVDFDGIEPGDEWPETYTVRTARGQHRYYTLGEGEIGQQSQGKLAAGIDVRGEGGFVVAAPTVRVDGGTYEIITPNVEPIWRPGRLVVTKEAPSTANTIEVPALEDGPDDDRWVSKALAEGQIKPGRNDMCARLTGYFIGKNLPQDVTLVQLLQFGARCTPPLTAVEVITTVNSVYRTATRREKERAAPSVIGVATIGIGDELDGQPLQFMRYTDFRAKYWGAQVDWLIKDWLPKASIVFVVSEPESFKSWLVGEMTAAVVTGTRFFDQAMKVQGPVLYIQQEDAHSMTASRLSAQIDSKAVAPPGADEWWLEDPCVDDLYVQVDREFNFGDKHAIRRLEEWIAKVRPAMVVFDPLYSMVTTDEHMVQAAQQMRVLKLLRDRYGTTFVIVHHAVKSMSLSLDRARAWGSQFLNAFVEGGIQIGKLDDHSILCKRHLKAAAAPGYAHIDWIMSESQDREYMGAYNPICRIVPADEAKKMIAAHNAERRGFADSFEDDDAPPKKRGKRKSNAQ